MTIPSFSAAADRNKQPILERLRALLAPHGRALEIASGTGQHLAWFADALPQWDWQPSDAFASALPAIATQIAQRGCANVREPVLLDVRDIAWPSAGATFMEPFDLVYCANMIHIAPWECCGALMRGCSRHLAPDGRLVLYGPYFEADVAAAQGNQDFDQSLRARDPAWGIRQLQDVVREAQQAGLQLLERHAMPSNNLLLVWDRAVA
ncbi:MAG: DUF938 domain-containing protein [Burkholderiaceae bacterium]